MVLAYHRITTAPSAYSYSVTKAQLDEHLAVVAEVRAGGRRAAVVPEITFDDGEKLVHQHGLDLLEKHSIRATVFVIAGWASTRSDFMTWAELRQLASLGHSVQSHGWSHQLLTRCSAPQLKEELVRSKRTIEDQLGTAVEALSVPHGRWNHHVLMACAAAGYQRVYISNPWISPQQADGVELVGRYMVRRSLRAEQLGRLLAGDPYLLFLLRSGFLLKETLKLLIGYAAYHRLWSFFGASDEPRKPEVIR